MITLSQEQVLMLHDGLIEGTGGWQKRMPIGKN